MPTGKWLRLDVPWTEDAASMRAVLAWSEGDGPLQFLPANGQKDVPAAVDSVWTLAAAKGIALGPELVIVYPHDARHGIAWAARDAADKRGCAFARHIPGILNCPPDMPSGYEDFDTGSAEDDLPPATAQDQVLRLNADAQASFSGGDLLEAMAPLRHALWLSLRHFGWRSPGTAYTLRNLGYTLNATGNEDNRAETLFLVARMLYLWTITPPDAAEWSESATIAETLAELCEQMGAPEFADILKTVRGSWG